jgi:hypothetical protein
MSSTSSSLRGILVAFPDAIVGIDLVMESA